MVMTRSDTTVLNPLDIEPAHVLMLTESNSSPHLPDNAAAPFISLNDSATATHLANNITIDKASLNLDNKGNPLTMRTAMAGPNKDNWVQADEEEFERFFKKQTIMPIQPHEVPRERRRDITYMSKQTKEKVDLNNEKTYRVRGTLGGDKTNYTGVTTANCADFIVVKVLLNAAISDPDSNWASIDIKDFYLQSQMDRPEYMRVPWNQIPTKIQQNFHLNNFRHNCFKWTAECTVHHKQAASHKRNLSAPV
jgi:hypothetical protein